MAPRLWAREERKVRDGQRWKKVELRPAQQFSRARQEEGGDPYIGLPFTYEAGTGVACQQQQAEGAGQGQLLAAGGEVGMQRSVSRKRWSFSPPKNWVERPSSTAKKQD